MFFWNINRVIKNDRKVFYVLSKWGFLGNSLVHSYSASFCAYSRRGLAPAIFKPNDKKEPWLIELLEPDDDKEDGEGEDEAQEDHAARQNCRVHVHLR